MKSMYYNLNANISLAPDMFFQSLQVEIAPQTKPKVYLGLICTCGAHTIVSPSLL